LEFPNFREVGAFHIGRDFYLIIIAPLFFLAFGTYCVLQSFKRSKILVIKTDTDIYHARVYDIEKQNLLNDMISFLEKKVNLEIIS
jgi:hypothetical protein